MSDRLADLRRQRTLIQEHLSWLDREIAAAEKNGGTAWPAPAPTLAAPLPQAAAPLRPAEPPLVISPPAPEPAPTSLLMPRNFGLRPQPALPSATLGEYRVTPSTVKQDVRKGCLLYFAAAFILLFAGVGILWIIFRR
jgi:hypothetical protein